MEVSSKEAIIKPEGLMVSKRGIDVIRKRKGKRKEERERKLKR